MVLLLHGFPECWYSWRHQLAALSDAGYHVVAPDQRGYGANRRTGRRGGLRHHPSDRRCGRRRQGVGRGEGGHCGARLGDRASAWNGAQLHPETFHAVITMSVPFSGRGAIGANRDVSADVR